jgi:hypothetical protein
VKDGIEVPHSRNEVVGPKVVVHPGEDHHAGDGTVVGKTVAVRTSHVLEDLDHRSMNEGFILHLIDGLLPPVAITIVSTDLTIGRTRGTP